MSRAAKLGLFLLMGLVVALARLVEVEVGKKPIEPLAIAGSSLGSPHAPPKHHDKPAHARAPSAPPQVVAPKADKTARPEKPKPVEAGDAEWPEGRVYTVKKGETLGEIAQKVLGSSKLWQKLLDANASRIPNPGALRPGIKLVVPEKH